MAIDKLLHFLVGFAIVVLIGPVFGLKYGLFASVGAGLAKEVYDSFHKDKHTVDAWDAMATIFGGSVATIILTWLGV